MKRITLLMLAALVSAHAQQPAGSPVVPAPGKEEPVRTVRLLIAGRRPMPVFEQRGDKYLEVEPPLKVVCPTLVEIGEEPKSGVPQSAEDAKKRQRGVSMNQVVKLENYKGSSQLRLKLLRPHVAQSVTPPVVTCSLGDMLEPLVVISAEDSNKAWENPLVQVIDLAPQKVPARTVIAVNLSKVPLAAFFESAQTAISPQSVRTVALPASTSEVFRFRVDAQTGKGNVPLVNSSYQLSARNRLILLAIPNPQAAQGMPPLSLQMVVDTPAGG